MEDGYKEPLKDGLDWMNDLPWQAIPPKHIDKDHPGWTKEEYREWIRECLGLPSSAREQWKNGHAA